MSFLTILKMKGSDAPFIRALITLMNNFDFEYVI